MSGYISRRDTDAVVRKSDNMIVGPEYQTEWAEYQQWLSQGNTPDEPLPLEEAPPIVTFEDLHNQIKELQDQIKNLKNKSLESK